MRANLLVSVFGLFCISSCYAAPSAPEAFQPLPLNERAIVIFEHSFQLIPSDGTEQASTATKPASGASGVAAKKPGNQVTLKFILLTTHNDNREHMRTRLVIFQDKDPYPDDKSGNTNKWFWSVYNKTISNAYDSLLMAQYPSLGREAGKATAAPEESIPVLFDFPVGTKSSASVSPGEKTISRLFSSQATGLSSGPRGCGRKHTSYTQH